MAREVSNSATSRDLGATSKGSRRKHISLSKKDTRTDAADEGQCDNEESEPEQAVMVPIEEPVHSSTTGSPKNRAGIPTIPGGSFERSGSRASANSHNSHNRTWYKRERPSFYQATASSAKRRVREADTPKSRTLVSGATPKEFAESNAEAALEGLPVAPSISGGSTSAVATSPNAEHLAIIVFSNEQQIFQPDPESVAKQALKAGHRGVVGVLDQEQPAA